MERTEIMQRLRHAHDTAQGKGDQGAFDVWNAVSELLAREDPTPVTVVVRHPDYENTYTSFNIDPRQVTHDIDMGRSDLSNSDELLDWANGHLDEADKIGNDEARTFIYSVIAEEVQENSDALDAEDEDVRAAGKALYARLDLDWDEEIGDR